MKKVERVGADTSRQRSEKKNKQKTVPSFFSSAKRTKEDLVLYTNQMAAVLTRR